LETTEGSFEKAEAHLVAVEINLETTEGHLVAAEGDLEKAEGLINHLEHSSSQYVGLISTLLTPKMPTAQCKAHLHLYFKGRNVYGCKRAFHFSPQKDKIKRKKSKICPPFLKIKILRHTAPARKKTLCRQINSNFNFRLFTST
jgi:hypothetical protein